MMTKEQVAQLAVDIANGRKDRFDELVKVARPLLVSLANKFSKTHTKFEFDDFYSIAQTALYRACLSYDKRNPSFLDYAKLFIIRDLCREVQYWNAEMRNIFNTQQYSIEEIFEDRGIEMAVDPIYEINNSIEMGQFRSNVDKIIASNYDSEHADIVRLYLFDSYRISEISRMKNMKYKKVYSFIVRSTEKIKNEYVKMLTLDNSNIV